MLQSWPITQNSATSPTPMTSNRTVHRESSTTLCCRRWPALDGPVMISPFLPDVWLPRLCLIAPRSERDYVILPRRARG